VGYLRASRSASGSPLDQGNAGEPPGNLPARVSYGAVDLEHLIGSVALSSRTSMGNGEDRRGMVYVEWAAAGDCLRHTISVGPMYTIFDNPVSSIVHTLFNIVVYSLLGPNSIFPF
jgi:hypothetical protein